jgi:hypothetical protein
VSPVVGKRTADATHALVGDVRQRAGGRVMRLMTSDEYPAYPDAIRAAYGVTVTPSRTGRPSRPRKAYPTLPSGLTYATVHKSRENGRVADVSPRVVFGTAVALALALAVSVVSRVVNTRFVERHDGTDRNRCSRKVRKGYTFSKGWETHRAATVFRYFGDNFCGPVRTLRVQVDGRWASRTPAMAAGRTDHVWPRSEWLAYPAAQRK